MIVLTVLSYNGAPASGLACTFDELGGTVGRADSNQLVLPDPERTISRVHARVLCRAGRYAVVDNGSNPISVNGQVISTGREHPLAAGDQLQIGGYLLAVSEATAASSRDPFADLFGDAAGGLAVPAPVSAPGMPGAAPQQWPSAAPAPAVAAAPPKAAPLAPGFIPDDWDPFAPQPAAAPAPSSAAPAGPLGGADLLLDLPGAASASLDDLFGLAGLPSASDPFAPRAVDPLGGGAAQALQLQANSAAHADPLQAFNSPVVPPPASRSDHVSELNLPMSLPQPQSPAPSAPFHASVPVTVVVPAGAAGLGAASSAAQASASPAALPAGAVFSWDNPPAEGRVVTLPGHKPAAAARATGATGLPPQPAVSAAVGPPAAASTAAPASAGSDALLAALLQGLDTPGLRLQQLDAETMLLLGQLLRESLRGTVELLVARSALKREMRAQMTMIVARENNPLKFSPTVEVALQHLLGPPTKGFMPPLQAVRDACDDLRAHQLGVMAGMRAALEGVLQRFNPELLEGKLTRKSAISSLIPGARKARLWELFQELFTQLQSEAQDDFDELFGKAFLRAYEDQLERLQGAPGP